MLKLETTTTAANDGAAVAANIWSRTCDSCHSAASAVYCRADLAYLCSACDGAAAAGAGRHERVWTCESCESAPAEFLCKADSASLCAACDAEIHSANPLARRHHRVPILPIHGGATAMTAPNHGELFGENGEDEDEAASWLLLNPMKTGEEEQSINGENGGLFGGEVDDYLDLEDYNHANEGYNNHEQDYGSIPQSSYGGDSVVPIQYNPKGKDCFPMGLDYNEASKVAGYGYHATLSHSVSMSSMDVGIVPESATNEAISASHTNRPPKGTIDLFSTPPVQIPTQLTPFDREARVLRYREKKKNRKFEKTIRYASRKAYAETRPRIKGRFAKRTDKVELEVEVEVDRIFSASALMAEENSVYGVVPSF